MLCDVCRTGLQNIWDPSKGKRIGLLQDFPKILRCRLDLDEDDELDDVDELLKEAELQEPERYVFGHHADYDSLAQSRRQGCVACNEFDDNNDRDDVNEHLASLGYYSVFCVDMSLEYSEHPTMNVFAGEEMELFTHEFCVHDENDHLNSILSSSTSDLQTWTLVETWLDKCLESHKICQEQSLTGFTPTRLLELRTTETEKEFRLVHHSELDPGERYVTLSHCWGPEPPSKKLQLLTSTVSTLRDGLPVAILPRTFRDAFEITERLHVRYIWIDRLCIIQDSAEDWRAESATMQTVYRNGFLNIAALGAANDQDGCFSERDPAKVGPTIVNLSPDHSLPSHYRHAEEPKTWVNDFRHEPLITRAWVLQERVLAARNLYFGRNQVFWECCTTTCCETIPAGPLLASTSRTDSGLDAAGASKAGRYPWKRLINVTFSSVRSDYGYLHNLLSEWAAAVEAYCACSLTFPSDKLVALSGLAGHMGNILRELDPEYDAYLAGIWRLTMPDSLLWKVKGPTMTRPSGYRAPSWSWASVDGPVEFPAGNSSKLCKLVDVLGVETCPRGENMVAGVSGGKILLRGPTCVAKGLDVNVKELANPLLNVRRIGSIHRHSRDTPINASITGWVKFDSLDDDQYDEVFIVPFWSRTILHLDRIDSEGLALVPVDESLSQYRRVGHVKIYIDVDTEDEEEDESGNEDSDGGEGEDEHKDLDSYNPLLDACITKTIEII